MCHLTRDLGKLQERIETNRDAMLRLASRKLKPEDAEDVVGQACLDAVRWINRYDPDRAEFRTWILSIVNNKINDRLRGLYSDPVAIEDSTCNDLTDSGSGLVEIEFNILIDDLAKRIPIDLRLVFSLVVIEGYSYDEVAKELEIPIGTVKSRLSAAREKMQNITVL